MSLYPLKVAAVLAQAKEQCLWITTTPCSIVALEKMNEFEKCEEVYLASDEVLSLLREMWTASGLP